MKYQTVIDWNVGEPPKENGVKIRIIDCCDEYIGIVHGYNLNMRLENWLVTVDESDGYDVYFSEIKMWAYYEEPKEIDNSPWSSYAKDFNKSEALKQVPECNMTPEQIEKILEYMKTDEFRQYMTSLILKDSWINYADVSTEEGETLD